MRRKLHLLHFLLAVQFTSFIAPYFLSLDK